MGYARTGRVHQKQRTRDALVAAGRALVADGVTPTVEMAAERARISRTSAYRYFPSQAALLAAAHPEITTVSLRRRLASEAKEFLLVSDDRRARDRFGVLVTGAWCDMSRQNADQCRRSVALARGSTPCHGFCRPRSDMRPRPIPFAVAGGLHD
jgi:AcrR family transcriptional regulator